MVSHSFLLHDILKANGINVSPASLSVFQGNTPAPDEAIFFLYFEKKSSAVNAIADLQTYEHLKKFRATLERSSDSWQLILTGKLLSNIDVIVSSLTSLAARFDGIYDGFEAPAPQ